MADFRYFTRSNGSFQGKPRVYFTAHPDDYDIYLEEIREELLRRHNCAVFYLDAKTAPDEVEDYALKLGEMQLFVIPVTEKLLTTPSRAMDVEIPFAFKHHIPVLTLMQDSGLEELYSQKFGDLQFLDKSVTDPTAIPYEEKLTKYLKSIIVGDKLARKIRDSFDAYIFLSYRKKDRKYAQELMRMIHSNPACRDIAIWYDEFLSPGESFNDAIKESLNKSDLFALAVTPNLLDDPNYIMDIEYPAAMESGKDIFPVEMLPTNSKELKEKYPGIPDAEDKNSIERFSKRLASIAEKYAIKENDSSADHMYYIGLAYLSGIDVEKDYEKAVKLITYAADQGYIRAIVKLISMYENGEGVERDYQKAVEMREKLLRGRTGIYRKKPSWKTARLVLRDQLALGSAYESMAQFLSARKTYEKMHKTCEEFAQEYDNKELDEYRADSAEAIGEILLEQYLHQKVKDNSYLDDAEKWYRNGLEIYEQIAMDHPDIPIRMQIVNCCMSLGRLAEIRGDTGTAEKWYQKGIQVAQATVEDMGQEDTLAMLVINYYQLGKMAKMRKDYDTAMKWLLKAMELCRELADVLGAEKSRSMLANSYGELGDIEAERGRLRQADSWYLKSLEIAEPLAKETSKAKHRHFVVLSYDNLSRDAERIGRFEEAEKWLRKSLAILIKTEEETNTKEAKIELANCYESFSLIAQKRGDFSEAEQWLLKSAEKLGEITKYEKKLDSYAYECMVHISMSLGYNCLNKKEKNKVDEAKNWFDDSFGLMEAIAQYRDTEEDYIKLADGYFYAGLFIRNREYMKKALVFYTKLAEQNPEEPEYQSKIKLINDILKKNPE